MAKLYRMQASEFGQDTLDFGEDGKAAFFNRNRELSGKQLQSSMKEAAYHEDSTERETGELVFSAPVWLDQTYLPNQYEGNGRPAGPGARERSADDTPVAQGYVL